MFSRVFVGIAGDAVPVVEHDYLYAALIPQIRDEAGRLIAAAMTCRTQIAAAAIMASRAGLPDRSGVLPLLDKHSELDLIAVDPSHRSGGLASRLLGYLEAELAACGVRVWFGNLTANLDVDRLREFYSSRGFNVLPDFVPLPPLLGRDWTFPNSAKPQFYFYKRPRN